MLTNVNVVRPQLQVKAAYKRKVWDVHPDLFPVDKASYAESQFKMVTTNNPFVSSYLILILILFLQSYFVNFHSFADF